MSMIVRGICWELEYAIRKDGDHQQEIALAVLTLLGAGRVEAARELKPRRPQPRTRRVQKKRRRQKKVFDPEKKCNELQEDIESEEDPWASTGRMDADEETLSKEQHAGKEAG